LLREQHHLFQDDVDARMVRVERRQQLNQVQAFETHILAWQQQQQAESVEEDREEDADTVSLSMVKPNPQSTRSGQQQQKIRISVRHGSLIGGVGEECCATVDAHGKDLTRSIPNRLGCMRD